MEATSVTYPPIPEGAPFLFENQDKPFAGDTFLEAEFLNLRDKFSITTAIETGTCYGSTTLWLGDHFNWVVTFENVEQYYSIAKDRSKDHANAMQMVYKLESSATGVYKAIEAIAESGHAPILFFLDAHFEQHCPLLDELKAIAASGIRPVIAIHDFMVPGRPDLGYDAWGGQIFRFSWIKSHLDAIYGVNKYSHHYNSQATGAKRGCIFVTPLP